MAAKNFQLPVVNDLPQRRRPARGRTQVAAVTASGDLAGSQEEVGVGSASSTETISRKRPEANTRLADRSTNSPFDEVGTYRSRQRRRTRIGCSVLGGKDGLRWPVLPSDP